ncbi:MAG: restriction endonuclease subunit S [Desulfobacterales bacterium]|nr:restriction endonuclease subunit S [Desulfobacterales bacterium]
MDVKTFLAEFGHIVNAPEGVQRLREMILQLAVQGKLVERIFLEGDAKQDVMDAINGKTAYIKRLKLRSSNSFPDIHKNEKPYDIPSHWIWERLDNIACYIQRGKSPTYDDSSPILVISQKCVTWLGIDLSVARNINKNSLKKYGEERLLKSGDLLWNSTGIRTAGRVCIYDIDDTIAVADSHVTVIRLSNFEPKYLLYLIASPAIQTRMIPNHENSLVSGTTKQVELPTGLVKSLPIPCPPIKEQKRIVAKVDELMALCDRLEAQQQKRSELIKIIRTAALDALANTQSPNELKVAWKRVQENMRILFEGAEDAKGLRKVIIDLALSGYLISDEEKSEETGNELLKKIEKARLTWEAEAKGQELKEAQTMRKKLNKQKYEIPDRMLPKNWSWGSFLQISQAVVDCHNKTAPYVAEGIHLVRTTDIRNGKMGLRHTKKISDGTYDFWTRRMPPKTGDIIFTREAPMGEAAIVPEGEKVCLGQRIMLIRLFSELFDNEFLLYAIYSPSFIDRMTKTGIGATVKHLRVGGAEDLIIPVPPFEEQKRIVAKVKSLMALCDTLESQLTKARSTAEKLAKSAVAAITGTQLEDKQKMKAPKTELVTKLRLKKSPSTKEQAPLCIILSKQHNSELSAKSLWNYSGFTIDEFYRQLKTEMAKGWIDEPQKAEMRIVEEKEPVK